MDINYHKFLVNKYTYLFKVNMELHLLGKRYQTVSAESCIVRKTSEISL